MNLRNTSFGLTAVITLAVDQATKAWVVASLPLHGEQVLIEGWLSIVHRRNSGAVLGTLQDLPYRQVLFAFFTLVAIGIVIDVLRRLPTTTVAMPAICGLLLGGALGNAIDRIRQQYVTDFINVHSDHPLIAPWLATLFGRPEVPSFNVADVALLGGMGLFVILYVRDGMEPAP